MKKSTKLIIGALCVLSSTTVLAHDYKGYKGEALPALIPVTIPNFNGGIEFTVEGLYLRPTSTNTRYLTVVESSSSPGGFIENDINRHDVDTDYGWGYLIGLGYLLPNSGNDVQASWMHFDNDSSESRNVFGGTGNIFLNPPVFHGPLGADETLFAEGELDTDFNALDLTFGQYVNFGPRLQTRMFGGLRYMKLESELETNYSISDGDGSTSEVAAGNLKSNFNGLGPVFGIKGDYNFGWGFGISGSIDAALLVGNLDFDGRYAFIEGTETTIEGAGDLNVDDHSVIAPGFDARFGLNYKYQMNNGSMVGLEIGYQVTKYIDVIEQIDGDNIFAGTSPTDFAFVSALETDVTNFGLNGLYLALNVKI